MERLSHEVPDDAEELIRRSARAFHDAVVLACYGLRADAEAPRAHALLGNVRTTATELAHRLREQGRDAATVADAVRDVIWDALATGGCDVSALRQIVETLAPLLDPE